MKKNSIGPEKIRGYWAEFWMRYAGLGPFGRFATRLAEMFAPPYKSRKYLRFYNPQGYISPKATIWHSQLKLGAHVFIGDDVIIWEGENSGPVEIGDKANLWGDSLLETGRGGSIIIGPDTRVNRGVQLVSYVAPIQIGRDVGLSSYSLLYSYRHGLQAGEPYLDQSLESNGPIIIEDHVWVGIGSIILSGVRIGKHAVVAAGSVVTRDVPEGAVVMGVPAKVVTTRDELTKEKLASS